MSQEMFTILEDSLLGISVHNPEEGAQDKVDQDDIHAECDQDNSHEMVVFDFVCGDA